MLYDAIENISQYTGMFEHLDTAIAYIEEHDLTALPLGKTVIDGENVFVNVMEAEPTCGEGRPFETHSKYMDLQLDIEGVELCEVALGELVEEKAYDADKDIALYHAETSAAMVLGEGRFAVFMVEEPHKPTIKAEGYDKIKKAVFKIAY
ncbi:MAG: YhcH/YjgK/YiaL family protein [Ruthenibacterium sp.]